MRIVTRGARGSRRQVPAVAAAGQGEDSAKLDDKEKARLREQASTGSAPIWSCAPSNWRAANQPTAPRCYRR